MLTQKVTSPFWDSEGWVTSHLHIVIKLYEFTREGFYGPWTEIIYNPSMLNYNWKSLGGNAE